MVNEPRFDDVTITRERVDTTLTLEELEVSGKLTIVLFDFLYVYTFRDERIYNPTLLRHGRPLKPVKLCHPPSLPIRLRLLPLPPLLERLLVLHPMTRLILVSHGETSDTEVIGAANL